jgi:hypothetical protein
MVAMDTWLIDDYLNVHNRKMPQVTPQHVDTMSVLKNYTWQYVDGLRL